ncbi:hypothetical protein BT93_L1084 [Corymbia citriodora subsp. variegata]|uniref:Disease resistance protein RPM1-like n=1 Tax=Corymbia citriodora subsp. variegata TaxID=360336 RepID=A0A8T0CPT0_CORYI|nr:hypothetical protein BT93_L1084 [Corymbia citriodora subsp. variegata]
MAESAVSFLIEKLALFIEKEGNLWKGVYGEIELIRDEFERMKAFLERAESSEDDDPELKVWVKQVRDVAYDVEDTLDEFTLNLARDHGDGYLHKIRLSINNWKACRRLSSKITDIKSRVISIGEGHRRYHFRSYCTEQSASTSTRGTSWYYLREDALLVEEGELVGIDKPREELIKWLVDEEPGLKVLSIFGMGGLGKTTLAKRVYDNQQVKAYFQHHAWINVSKSYEIEDILTDMIVQLHREIEQLVPQGIESTNRIKLNQIVKGFLQQKRYVIVLDDVWNSNALEAIKYAMPSSSFCSRILITTRTADVATSPFNQSTDYKLEPVSRRIMKAFHGNPCPPHLENLSRQILKKCEGLPLAIVTIGGLLSTKDVFPEDHVIECMRLIRLWIAEGFIEERERMTREEIGQRYLKELINRSLVQIAETTLDRRIRSCRVHDLMRESILSKSRDINFVSFASEQKVKLHEKVRRLSIQYTCNNALKQLNLPSLRSLLIFESATSCSSDEQFVPSGCRLLRVLDLGGSSLHKFPQEIPVLFHLKYLSLRRTKVSIIPRSIGKLQNLETLDLKHTLVSKLPMEINKLKKLHDLLVYSYAEKTRVRPFHSITGFLAPRGIGALASLQKLCYVKAGGDRSKNTIQELGELCRLRRLGIVDLKTDDAEELCHSIEKMTDLRSLNVTAESESKVIDLDFLSSPPLLLRMLYIKGCLKKLPHWLPLLNNLARVHLRWSRLKSSPLITLQNLPNLVELELDNTFDGETLVFEDRGFPKLKTLGLEHLENLRLVSMNGEAMPCLQTLIISRCRQLDWQSFVVVTRSLTLLKYLRFDEMPEEFALAFYPYGSNRMREGILQDCHEELMKRIPQVYFDWWEEDKWVRYDLSLDCYKAIKGRVMNRDEVLPEVS